MVDLVTGAAEGFDSIHRTYIIAEIGVNHDGSLDKAQELIQAAAVAGADAAKFQHFRAHDLASPDTPFAPYQRRNSSATSHFSMLKSLELDFDSTPLLVQACADAGLDFLSTPYGPQQVDLLADLGVKFIKTASADIVDGMLHERIVLRGIPCIASTGMARRSEVARLVQFYKNSRVPLSLLHTTSLYPTPIEFINLRRMTRLMREFRLTTGFSDHSIGHMGAQMAVALGAKIIEKHITLDSASQGPDHASSMEPGDFSRYVQAIRSAEAALGSEAFKLVPGEELMKRTSRKSLHVNSRVQPGDVISREVLCLRRPGDGIPWSDVHLVLGTKANRVLLPGTKLHLSDVSRY